MGLITICGEAGSESTSLKTIVVCYVIAPFGIVLIFRTMEVIQVLLGARVYNTQGCPALQPEAVSVGVYNTHGYPILQPEAVSVGLQLTCFGIWVYHEDRWT